VSNLETHLRALIREELAKLLGTATGAVYSTEPTSWPPGCRTRRAARDRIRAVPSHAQIGTGRATVWRVSVDAYQRHYARRLLQRVVPVVARSDEELAEAALARHRPTKRAS
jgi:hypothetical protein